MSVRQRLIKINLYLRLIIAITVYVSYVCIYAFIINSCFGGSAFMCVHIWPVCVPKNWYRDQRITFGVSSLLPLWAPIIELRSYGLWRRCFPMLCCLTSCLLVFTDRYDYVFKCSMQITSSTTVFRTLKCRNACNAHSLNNFEIH